jgi:thiamine monophosphate kinase
VPRIEAGLALSACDAVHAAIDVSDGISKESLLLSYENNLVIELEDIERFQSQAMKNAKKYLGKGNWENWFFNGGEDYELLFAAAPSFDPRPVCRAAGVICRQLGRFSCTGYGLYVANKANERYQVQCAGWDHFGPGL